MSALESLGGSFDPDKLKQELEHLDKSLQDPENWKNHSKLNALNKEKTTLEQKLDEFKRIEDGFNEISDLVDISIELGDESELSNQEDAINILEELGLVATVTGDTNGVVRKQIPRKGEFVEPESVVELTFGS